MPNREEDDRRRRLTLIDWMVLYALMGLCFVHAFAAWVPAHQLAEGRAHPQSR